MKKFIILAWIVLLASTPVWAGEPLEALKGPLDKGISLLRDPQYKAPEMRDEQREKIWDIVRGIFDFKEISARAVGKDWRKFTDAQKKEFTEVFASLLRDTYLDKIQGAYQNEEVAYLEENLIRDNLAIVKTQIIRESVGIPVDYSMLRRDEGWKVYDVQVENVSLTKNYRTQFGKYLFRHSPAELISELKKKIEN